MIACRLHHLLQRCVQRGYSLQEVSGCIVSQEGDLLTVDETHPSYPATPREPGQSPVGAGTYLKGFFSKWFGQEATPDCSCSKAAAQMDTMGPQWCRDNMDWILGQIQQNAEKRKLPFIRAVVEPVVLIAIRKAERAMKQGQ